MKVFKTLARGVFSALKWGTVLAVLSCVVAVLTAATERGLAPATSSKYWVVSESRAGLGEEPVWLVIPRDGEADPTVLVIPEASRAAFASPAEGECRRLPRHHAEWRRAYWDARDLAGLLAQGWKVAETRVPGRPGALVTTTKAVFLFDDDPEGK